jgi:hypothetical protein
MQLTTTVLYSDDEVSTGVEHLFHSYARIVINRALGKQLTYIVQPLSLPLMIVYNYSGPSSRYAFNMASSIVQKNLDKFKLK